MRGKSIAALCFVISILSGTQVQAESWEYDCYTDENDCIVYDFEEVQLKLPSDWMGKYDVEFFDGGVDFFHVTSRQGIKEEGWTDKGGRLFSLCFSENTKFEEYLPAYKTIGDGKYGTYYLDFPTDVQGYQNNGRIFEEWMGMAEDVEWVKYYAVMKNYAANVTGSVSCGDYIIQDSDRRYLEESDVAGMNVGKMQMAINEIYARRGRKFQNTEIREYFETKPWYKGTIKPDKFNEDGFNKYESENISLLLECIANPPVGVQPTENRLGAELEAVG